MLAIKVSFAFCNKPKASRNGLNLAATWKRVCVASSPCTWRKYKLVNRNKLKSEINKNEGKNELNVFCLTNHTTKYLQSLDHSFFKPLKTYCLQPLNAWIHSKPYGKLSRLEF